MRETSLPARTHLPPGAGLPPAVKRLLILRGGAVGDNLLSFPTLVAIRRTWPRAWVRFAGHPEVGRLFQRWQVVDEAGSIDDPAITSLFADEASPFDPGWLEGLDAAVVWLGPAGSTVGAALAARGTARIVVRDPLEPSEPPRPAWLHLLQSVVPWGVHVPTPPAVLVPAAPDRQAAHQYLAGYTEGPLAALHAGSGGQWKCWPPERFAALARRLEDALGCRFLVTVGPADGPSTEALLAAWEARQPPLVARDLPLWQLGSLLEACALFVGADSGITHLAGILGIPTIALFGPTDPLFWRPYGPRVQVVTRGLPCSACGRERALRCSHRLCLAELEVEEVLRAALSRFSDPRDRESPPAGPRR